MTVRASGYAQVANALTSRAEMSSIGIEQACVPPSSSRTRVAASRRSAANSAAVRTRACRSR